MALYRRLHNRADPLLHYKFEKAGEYIIQIRDVTYAGNPYWVYRLSVTKRPYITTLLPMGIRPGAATEITTTLSGTSLPSFSTARSRLKA